MRLRALLFDIDGTLTRSGGAGSRALGAALGARPRAGSELRKMRLDGMTDRSIARTLLAAEHGDPALPIADRAARVSDADIDAVLAQYLTALEQECARSAYSPMPGVPELLRALQGRADALLGLCTGNVARGAELKLTAAGLWGPFRFGGYGSDAEPRADIVRTAWARAQALGATEALVIGDTPRDVLAAHDAGLPACGVATGRWTLHDLLSNGADAVLESFADLDRALAILIG
jgi:phosphoglycolate phosphatase-like HAD superfamily hydrolase